MSNFKPFAAAIAAQIAQMSKGELYRVAVEGDVLWNAYLAAFPEGTNPIYRVRTWHDGSYDRAFVKRMGNVVRINDDGSLTSIWDAAGLAHPYNVVASKLSLMVRQAALDTLFRTKEKSFGYVSTIERDKITQQTTEWNHFHCNVDKKHQNIKPDEVIGEFNTTVGVINRGFSEIKQDAVDTVLDLINQNALYRGAEFKAGLEGFRTSQMRYFDTIEGRDGDNARQAIVFQSFGSAGARIRNTAIGTLLQDLSEGIDVEKAVKSFEAKVAPANYKRPTAVVTPKMIEQAVGTIRSLDLEPALARRFANISDISINNVLWADGNAAPLMRDGLTDMLMKEVKAPKIDAAKAEKISIDDFLKNILPKATGLEAYMGNKLRSNLVSLTAPVDPNAGSLFKWGNNFAWSYNGNIADSEMRRAVEAKGGRVDGAFRFTHQWNYGKRNASLMDLHVFMPGSTKGLEDGCNDNYGNNERVGWNRRTHPVSGGVQDVDYVNEAPPGYVPVENITFPDIARMKEGRYTCRIHNWRARNPNEGGFRAEIEFDGQVFEYELDRPLKNKEWVTVAHVELRAGQFTIQHVLPSNTSSQEVWGIKTEQFVKVDTVLNSPNHWDGEHTGNKHVFFILHDCFNNEAARGIYNEFLKPELEKHRKVFELLGNKTKCDPMAVDSQLSGLGFSTTKRDSLIVKVTNASLNKLYEIQF